MTAQRTAREPLSVLLRAETRASHRLAEEAPFVRALLRGRIAPDVYVRFLRSLHSVYAEMETALDANRSHPVLSQLDLPELRRRLPLEDDLRWWGRACAVASEPASPATRAYAERIRELARSSPVRLVGHLYTRYLGDLSGGQLIARALERAFGLEDGKGVAFYRFGDEAQRARLKERFRARLDGLPLDAATSDLVIAEASRAFDHNVRVFDELVPPNG